MYKHGSSSAPWLWLSAYMYLQLATTLQLPSIGSHCTTKYSELDLSQGEVYAVEVGSGMIVFKLLFHVVLLQLGGDPQGVTLYYIYKLEFF